jgi:hypothetical protein
VFSTDFVVFLQFVCPLSSNEIFNSKYLHSVISGLCATLEFNLFMSCLSALPTPQTLSSNGRIVG